MTDDDHTSRPGRAIEQAYLNCLEARLQWLRSQSAGMDPDQRETLHANLHTQVLAWFESLYKHLSSRDDLTKYWDDVRLWRREPVTNTGLQCPDCGAWQDPNNVPVGGICTTCNTEGVQRQQFHVHDDGDPQYKWQTGLKTLEDWQGRTTTITRKEGTFRPTTKTYDVPERLKPTILFRAARYLDESAAKIGLLEDVDKEVTRTEVDQELVSEFHDRLQSVMDEVEHGTGAAAGMDADALADGGSS